MYVKQRENNVKNCINIDLKCLIKWSFGVFQAVRFTNTKRKERILEAFYSVRKFYYLQLEFDNYEHNCPPQVRHY